MIIFNCLGKGFVKIDGDFSVSTIIKEVSFHQDGKECTLPEIEYLELLKKGSSVKYPCEIGDLIITTPTNRYIFQDVTLSVDNSVYLTDEILDYLTSNIKDECIVINLDCPNEDNGNGTKFFCNGNLIVDKI